MSHPHNLSHHHHKKYRQKTADHERNKWQIALDLLMYPIGLIGPLMMIPQILKIYLNQDASSIAVSSWILFFFGASFWVIYGFTHRDKIIIISNIAWLISYGFVIGGAFLY